MDAESVSAPRWLFQANPARWPVFKLVKKDRRELWQATAHAKDMAPDQKGALWVAGPDGGVLALFVIEAPAFFGPEPDQPGLPGAVKRKLGNVANEILKGEGPAKGDGTQPRGALRKHGLAVDGESVGPIPGDNLTKTDVRLGLTTLSLYGLGGVRRGRKERLCRAG